MEWIHDGAKARATVELVREGILSVQGLYNVSNSESAALGVPYFLWWNLPRFTSKTGAVAPTNLVAAGSQDSAQSNRECDSSQATPRENAIHDRQPRAPARFPIYITVRFPICISSLRAANWKSYCDAVFVIPPCSQKPPCVRRTDCALEVEGSINATRRWAKSLNSWIKRKEFCGQSRPLGIWKMFTMFAIFALVCMPHCGAAIQGRAMNSGEPSGQAEAKGARGVVRKSLYLSNVVQGQTSNLKARTSKASAGSPVKVSSYVPPDSEALFSNRNANFNPEPTLQAEDNMTQKSGTGAITREGTLRGNESQSLFLDTFFGALGSVLSMLSGTGRRAHYTKDLNADKQGQHAGALVPFDTNPEWVEAARRAGTDLWEGYGRNPEEDGSDLSASNNYQEAIRGLINKPEKGGIELAPDSPRARQYSPWVWNAPTTGQMSLTVYGMGFGWNPQKCSQQCLDAPFDPNKCPDFSCLFIDSSIGSTTVQQTTWSSDSSLTMMVPPGIGSDLSVNVTVGRFKTELNLFKRFSYDAPVETRVGNTNSPLAGNTTMTLFGLNFGVHRPKMRVVVGETDCSQAIWMSDTSVVCSTVQLGSGALHRVKALVEGRPSENIPGITRSFSYDAPFLTAIYPANGPPSGFNVITLFGRNFGPGPRTTDGKLPACPIDSPGQFKYIFRPRLPRERICGTGFAMPLTKRFNIEQYEVDESGNQVEEGTAGLELENLRWDNIRPFSLVHDPVACILNEYLCSYKKLDAYCLFLRESCMALSNVEVIKRDKYWALESLSVAVARPKDPGKKWYAVTKLEAGCEHLAGAECPPRIVSGYMKDGVNCDALDYSDPELPQPYFEKNKIFGTDYLCGISPRAQGGCSSCPNVGCCNKKGTFGARVSATECITLQWLSDSSMACRVAPGLGFGHNIMIAVDDQEGSSLDLKPDLFSFDLPTISSMETNSGPTAGGKTYEILGKDFGVFACNRTWCSSDADLLRCNATRCSLPNEPDSSILESQKVSLQATYDMSTIFRTACAAVKWSSDTALSCTTAPGTGDLREIELRVEGNTNLFTLDLMLQQELRSLKYNMPSMTGVSPNNIAANSGKNVTIVGKDFGLWDTKVKARMSGTACIETYWISDTVVKCLAPKGIIPPICRGIPGAVTTQDCKREYCNTCFDGASSTECERQYDTHPLISAQGICGSIVLTVDRLRGFLSEAFTYEGPVITGLNPTNGPPTGGFNITMQGESFGDNPQYGYTGQIGESKCTLMTWTSDTAISCSIGLGVAFSHVPRMDISWNKAMTRNMQVLFTFNSPVVQLPQPNLIPATGGIKLSIFGAHFGAFSHFEFPDTVKLPSPPKATIGDTPCGLTQWLSDSSVTCSILAAGQGPGAGVGGRLPVEVKVGNQNGIFSGQFGYNPPDVDYADAVNGPALGNNVLLIQGNHFGTSDYCPTAKVGETDCKLTRWISNTAVSCTVPRCTTYLAGGNIELPLQVVVGLGHRVTSFQSGTRENYYFFDLPIELQFKLTNEEINLFAFFAAVLLAGVVIVCFHSRYRKAWSPPIPSLPSRYARTRHDQLEKIKVSRKITSQEQAGDNYEHSSGSAPESSESDDDFYDLKITDKPLRKEDQVNEGKDEAFRRGQKAVLFSSKTKYSKILAKDVITGQPILHTQDEDEEAAGVGEVEPAVFSVSTPLPSTGHKHSRKKFKEDTRSSVV
jgi:hypothetical protein